MPKKAQTATPALVITLCFYHPELGAPAVSLAHSCVGPAASALAPGMRHAGTKMSHTRAVTT